LVHTLWFAKPSEERKTERKIEARKGKGEKDMTQLEKKEREQEEGKGER
jgi:hypothetical protein